MSISGGIAHFFESILELITGIFAQALHAVQFALHSVVSAGVGAWDLVVGVLDFVLHNLLGIAIVAVAAFVVLLLRNSSASANVSAQRRKVQ
jgi:hypothetical protein